MVNVKTLMLLQASLDGVDLGTFVSRCFVARVVLTRDDVECAERVLNKKGR